MVRCAQAGDEDADWGDFSGAVASKLSLAQKRYRSAPLILRMDSLP